MMSEIGTSLVFTVIFGVFYESFKVLFNRDKLEDDIDE